MDESGSGGGAQCGIEGDKFVGHRRRRIYRRRRLCSAFLVCLEQEEGGAVEWRDKVELWNGSGTRR